MSRFQRSQSTALEITCLDEAHLKVHCGLILENAWKNGRSMKDYHGSTIKEGRSVRSSLNEVIALAIHPASSFAAWSRIDGSLSVLRPPSASERTSEHSLIGSIKKDVHGEGKIVYSISWNPNELQFVTVGNTPTIQLWNVVDNKLSLLKEFKTNYKAKNFITSYDASGKYLLVVTKSNELYVYDVDAAYKLLYVYSPPNESEDTIHSVCWSHDSGQIIVGYRSGFIKLFELTDNDLVLKYERRNNMRTITSLVLDPLGRSLLVGADNECSIWSLPDLIPSKKSPKTKNSFRSIDISFDGSIVTVTSSTKNSNDCIIDFYWYNDMSLLYSTSIKNCSCPLVKWSTSHQSLYAVTVLDKISFVDVLHAKPSPNEKASQLEAQRNPERRIRGQKDLIARKNQESEPRKSHKRDLDRFSEKPTFGRNGNGKFRKPNDRW